jgi:PhzF family phenazine biosynthesis protein
MNLSETVFLRLLETPNSFHIRWFTPEAEVDLCGHATVAAAHHLFTSGSGPAPGPC